MASDDTSAQLSNARLRIARRDKTIGELRARVTELEAELAALKAKRRVPHVVPNNGRKFPR